MTELVAKILLLMTVASLVVAIAIALVAWRLHRRNRVSPRTPTAAPVTWLASPQRASRLHRRLRSAVATARFRPPGTPKRHVPAADIAAMVDDLERHACALDEQLVMARYAPPAVRRRLYDTLEAEVRRVEELAGRMASARHAPALSGPDGVTSLERITERLDALDEARREIARLEASLGLQAVAERQPLSPPRPEPPR